MANVAFDAVGRKQMTIEQTIRTALAAAMAADASTAPNSRATLAEALRELPFYSKHPSPAVRIGNAFSDARPAWLAHQLVTYAEDHSLDAALSALRDFSEIDSPTATTYVYVENVESDVSVDLGGGVIALPVEAAPPPLLEMIERTRSPLTNRKGVVLAVTEPIDLFPVIPADGEFITHLDKIPPTNPGWASIETALRMVTAWGPCAPSPKLKTIVINSNALRLYDMGSGPTFVSSEMGVAGKSPVLDDGPSQLWPLYMALSKSTRIMINGAIDRLNLACARHHPSNAIVDAAISLEAALGDSGNKTELTYRLKLRAALLIEQELSERQKTRKLVNDLYTERSRVVHTGLATSSDLQLWADGLALASRVILKILRLGGIPDWSVCELSGGAELGEIS